MVDKYQLILHIRNWRYRWLSLFNSGISGVLDGCIWRLSMGREDRVDSLISWTMSSQCRARFKA